jgi:hypothetical protein
MIAKKISNPKKSSSKYVRIQRLVDYVRNPKKGDKEKCVYEGTRNFFEENKKAQVKEMQDLAHAAVRSKDPINHYVISWKSHEKPTKEQIERSVDIVLDELKMREHKVIYAVHADTKHHHLHLVVNRVHPETERVVLPNRGLDIEVLHKAVARIEHEQGWKKEPRARYRVEGNELHRNHYEKREKQPSQEKQAREQRTGLKSAERMAQEKAPTVIRAASSWRALHEDLAKEGLRYEPKGRNGAVVVVGDIAVKASRVGREFSLGNLQKRLGEFEPSVPQMLKKVHPEPIQPQSVEWHRYQREKALYEGRKKSAVAELREKHAQEKCELATKNKEKQAQLLSQDWKGRGKELNAERNRLATENKAALSSLKVTQASESQSLKQKYPAIPSLGEWRAKQRQHQAEQTQQLTPEPTKQVQQEQTKQQKEQERATQQQPARRKQPDIER